MQNVLSKHFRRPPRPVLIALGLVAALAAAVGFMYYWRVVYYLDNRGVPALLLYGAAAVFVLAAALVVWAGSKLRSFDAKAALAIVLCGALFCFANPPLQEPDEAAHVLRSYT